MLFPMTKTSTKHIFSLGYGDEFVCRAGARDASIKIPIDFEIHRPADGAVCAKGRGEQVAVKSPEMETLCHIPPGRAGAGPEPAWPASFRLGAAGRRPEKRAAGDDSAGIFGQPGMGGNGGRARRPGAVSGGGNGHHPAFPDLRRPHGTRGAAFLRAANEND
ncbi:MAG: hypothetical protein ACLFTV_17120 [Desulfococcaceae bacterium]